MESNRYLHMCLEAPSDWTAWKYMKHGEKCKFCAYEHKDETVTKEQDGENGGVNAPTTST